MFSVSFRTVVVQWNTHFNGIRKTVAAEWYTGFREIAARAVAAAPQTPQLGGPTLPKRAPNCLEGPEVASIQKQSFAWRIALNGIFCAQFYIFQF